MEKKREEMNVNGGFVLMEGERERGGYEMEFGEDREREGERGAVRHCGVLVLFCWMGGGCRRCFRGMGRWGWCFLWWGRDWMGELLGGLNKFALRERTRRRKFTFEEDKDTVV